MYCGPPDQLLDLNWNQTMDPSGHFESALSSIVSSSQSSSSPVFADGMVFHKLMGGLQSMSNPGDEISPQPHHIGGRLNSPPKLNLSMMGHFHQQLPAMGGLPASGNPMHLAHLDQFSADLGFAERVGRLSGFDGRNYSHVAAQFGLPDTEKLPRAASSQSLKTTGLQIGLPEGRKGGLQLDINNGELVSAREESSVSDPASGEVSLGGPARSNAKKRKAPLKDKGKEASIANSAMDPPKVTEDEESNARRCRSTEKNGNENDAVKPKVEQNDGCSSSGNGGQKQGRDSTARSPEPPKDYIHVRARRGQATDSHSLAERVRREKISQRMKLLQDLVPGCNKVTGKAVMLDEIINYVQSLQRQVEFLSMKLATVNPHLDFNNLANLLPKDLHRTCGPMPNSVYSLETSGVTPPYVNQPQQGTSLHCVLPNGMETQNSVNLLDPAFHQNLNTHQPFLTGFESTSSQLGNFWDDDLQNVTHMDIGQN